MKLDRNLSQNKGQGKYALVNLRRVASLRDSQREEDKPAKQDLAQALETLEKLGVVEWGAPYSENEFFVIKLKDKFADAALRAYSAAAGVFDTEWAQEILDLSRRAGRFSKFCKTPD